MTEDEWLKCTDPTPMLDFLRGKVSERKLRLFACACCRRIWHCLADARSRKSVDVSEGYADGGVTWQYMEGVNEAAYKAYRTLGDNGAFAAWSASMENGHADDTSRKAALASYSFDDPAWLDERDSQCDLLRDIVDNLFHHVTLDPAWLAWNDGAVPKLAKVIYDDRAFDRLPLLADALEDAGCTDAALLAHCREPGEHVRGCWVVDLLLGKS